MRQTLGLGAVGRVEVVALLEDLELEVPKHTAEALRDLLVMIRVAECAEREVDGSVETLERLSVDAVSLEGVLDRADRLTAAPEVRLPVSLRTA
jgi:hypothetical protein